MPESVADVVTTITLVNEAAGRPPAGAVQHTFRPASRVNRSLTAAVEGRLLVWLAARTPAVVTSDHLTLLGLLAQVGAGVAFAAAREHRGALALAVVCILLNWLGDSLDGTLARCRGQQRPRYGFYVDHMVDVFGALALCTGLGCSGFVHWPVAAGMLVSFLLLACESYLSTYTLSRFELAQAFFGPTELRLLLIAGTLALLRNPHARLHGHTFLLFDVGCSLGAGAMLLTVAVLTVQHAAELSREEPLHVRAAR